MSDTAAVQETRHSPRVLGSGRSSRPASLVGAALLLLVVLPGLAAAEPAPLDARVVWVRGPHAYVAARDSLALLPTSRLTIAEKSKTIATGEVERTVDGGMVVVRITSGSLAGVKHLDRLRILAEPLRGPRLLRVGYPSRARSHVLITRGGVGFSSLPEIDDASGDRRMDIEGPELRLIPKPDDPASARWPDSVLVRTFDDATDQEIALERGELDVGVFWPGELSLRMREHPRWKDRLSWPLQRGLIAAIPESGSAESRCAIALRTAKAFQGIGGGYFRGDADVSRQAVASCMDTITTSPPGVRFEVDPACPGGSVLERILNRGVHRGPPIPVALVRVSCVDPRTYSSDDVIKLMGITQMVCAPDLLPYARELGPAGFAAILDRLPPERRP